MRAPILVVLLVLVVIADVGWTETINTNRLVLTGGEVVEMCDGLIQPDGGRAAVAVSGGSTFILSGGVVAAPEDVATIEARDSRIIIKGGRIDGPQLGGTVTINVANSSVEVTGGEIGGSGETTIRLGQNSSLVMSGGEVEAHDFAISARDGSNVTLKGNARVFAWGEKVVSGGSGEGNLSISDDAVVSGDPDVLVSWSTGNIRITGGTIAGDPGTHVAVTGGRGEVFISGGLLEGQSAFHYQDGTMVTITGGQFIAERPNLDPLPIVHIDNTPVNIFGGFFDGDIRVDGTEEVNIWGRDLTYEGGRLTGTLADLTPVDLMLFASNLVLHNTVLIVGDNNADGTVNIVDLNNVRNNFGAEGGPDGSLLGDVFPYDGRVDINDLNAVRNNFGATADVQAIPEPSTFTLATLMLLVVSVWRKRR